MTRPSPVRVLVAGAGNIGRAIAWLLGTSPDFTVTVADRDERHLVRVRHAATTTVDMADDAALARLAAEHDIVVNAAPFHLTERIAIAAVTAGAHYFDLTEDTASSRLVCELGETAAAVVMPQCGLAPGFVSVVAASLAAKFDELRSVSMRVGALPQFPTNALKYNLTWSTDGLVNEYCNPCQAIVDGELLQVAALGDLETFSLDGVTYEAFNTSGGLGTLCDTLLGRVETLNYKTVRYPGHRDVMKLLIGDLRLSRRRDLLKDVLETAIPITYQDVVLVFVTASGRRDGVLTQESYARKIYAGDVAGMAMSAIQLTTAAAACAMVDLVRDGTLPGRGLIRQEDCPLETMLANRYGALYLHSQAVAA